MVTVVSSGGGCFSPLLTRTHVHTHAQGAAQQQGSVSRAGEKLARLSDLCVSRTFFSPPSPLFFPNPFAFFPSCAPRVEREEGGENLRLHKQGADRCANNTPASSLPPSLSFPLFLSLSLSQEARLSLPVCDKPGADPWGSLTYTLAHSDVRRDTPIYAYRPTHTLAYKPVDAQSACLALVF